MTQYLSISALTKYIKAKFERDPYLQTVYIKGELSNVKLHSSGHLYFALKDGGAVLNGMMFKGSSKNLNFTPKEGDQVLIQGRISVYEGRGSYQLYVTHMALDGVGQLYERFEALKKELSALGYFNSEHKKTIKKYPERIAVITASTGAAIRDIESTLTSRFPLAEVHYISTLVQGDGAVTSIVKNIRQADEMNVDVIIVGRGGGSIEDLWAFNEREVVQAIFDAKTPVISAVGHETDTTLSDFVADLRAATPTAAAVLATPDQFELINQLKQSELFMANRLNAQLSLNKERLNRYLSHAVLKNPVMLIEQKAQRVDDYERRLQNLTETIIFNQYDKLYRHEKKLSADAIYRKIERKEQHLNTLTVQMTHSYESLQLKSHQQLNTLTQLLHTLNPTAVLGRGYSIVRNNKGIISKINQVERDDLLNIQVSDGYIHSVVKEKEEQNND